MCTIHRCTRDSESSHCRVTRETLIGRSVKLQKSQFCLEVSSNDYLTRFHTDIRFLAMTNLCSF